MANQMEFWNSDTKGVESGEIEWWNGWVGREAMLEVLSPLAGDIVGNNHIGDPHLNTLREGGHHGIVNVGVSKFCDQLNQIGKKQMYYLSPFWRSTTLFGRMNAWWQETAATPVAAYPCEFFVNA